MAGLETEFIKEYYSKLSDQELTRIISEDAHGLIPEAVAVVRDELAKRKLDPKLGNVVEAQNRQYSTEELNGFCRIIEVLPCPECKKTAVPLTAAMISKTMSFLVVTQQNKKLSIGCPDCVRSENNAAVGISLLLGWWGFPWGPIKTFQSISNFFKSNAALQEPGPNDYLRGFVLSNIGLMTLHKNAPEKIDTIINNVKKGRPLTENI